jgi:glyceraldehyde 3-phosphate dehydrogenase
MNLHLPADASVEQVMAVRVGINGFGRMGRLALRAAFGNPDFMVVQVNEPKGGPETAAHLLEFDSVHGRWPVPIVADSTGFTVNGHRVGFSRANTPEEIAWDEAGAEVVLECSGKFLTPEALAPHFKPGVSKVIVAAPVKQGALNVVMGVNDHLYDPQRHQILTAASCTTNCLAPVVKVVHERIGIRHGVITTLHDATNTQTIVDAPHNDLRRARSALLSLIPTTTGSATAIGLIYPELQGKLNGLAIRVPLLNASLTDCVFEVARPTTIQEVNGFLKEASVGPLHGILGFEDRPLVSADFVNDPRSSVVDGPSTMVIDGTQVKILAWYDNEWGYVNRLAALTSKVVTSLPALNSGAAGAKR